MTSETKSDSRPLVTVTLDEARSISAYTVNVPDGTVVGRADFVDTEAGERIFFHTEVDREFAGQGLAGMLLREALADSIRKSITVVPVCPLFANHLKEHGDAYVADGGSIRWPTDADINLVRHTIRPER